MRLMTRCFGLCIILIISMMIFMQLMIFNVKKDELVTSISQAMTSTQIIISEQIEDELFQTNNKRKTIHSNKEYLEEFVNHFNCLVHDSSSFKFKVFGIDYTKGFLDIEVESYVKMLNGQQKIMTARKCSIVDIITKEETCVLKLVRNYLKIYIL